MRSLRKRIAVAVAVATLAAGKVSAQGYPVFDLSNWLSAVNQAYNMYLQLNNIITQVQNTYTQIDQAVKQVKNFDWSNVADAGKKYAKSWSDLSDMSAWEILTNKDKVMATKANLTNLTREVSDSVNVYTNVIHKLDESTVEVNGKKFSPLGLMGVGKHGDGTVISLGMNALAQTARENAELIDAITREKSLEEQEAIMRMWGIDRDAAMAAELAEAVIDGQGDMIIVLGQEEASKAKANMDASKRMASQALDEMAGEEESLQLGLESISMAVDNASDAIHGDLEAIKMKNSYDVMRDRQQKAIEQQKAEEEVNKSNTDNTNEMKRDKTVQELNSLR